MTAAYQRTPFHEAEDRAWILTHIAHLELMQGKIESAEQLLLQALHLFPDYHYALAHLAKVRTAQQRHAEAVGLLQGLYQAAPHPEYLYALAEGLERAGQPKDARAAYAKFEQQARREMESADNSNRELIFYFADHADQPAEALGIAKKEVARRRDVHTLDAGAWALYVNGEYAEARKQIENALAVGIHDAKLFCHAGAIALKLDDREAATHYLRASLGLNPFSECSATARHTLATLVRSQKDGAQAPLPY